MGQPGQASLRLKRNRNRKGVIVDSQKSSVEELQALKESLEMQRRLALALILERQDEGGGPEATEKPRLKLAVVNQELAQCKSQINNLTRRQLMPFETPEKMETMKRFLQKSITPALKEAVRIRDEVEVKGQVLSSRLDSFESLKADRMAEREALKGKISQILGEGQDPSEVNLQLRAVTQEIEDLDSWMAQLKDNAIPEAQKALSEAQRAVWKDLLSMAHEAKMTFAQELNDHLAQAAEFSHSWQVAIRNFFEEHRSERGPSDQTLTLPIDPKRTFFVVNQWR